MGPGPPAGSDAKPVAADHGDQAVGEGVVLDLRYEARDIDQAGDQAIITLGLEPAAATVMVRTGSPVRR